jgi:O-antigen ligase
MIDLQSLRRIVSNPVGGFPLLFVALGVLGMLWADVPWMERFAGVTSFLKLLFIPLLMHQFSRTGGGRQVLIGFLVSCGLLLALSWLMIAWPGIPWHSRAYSAGIPVKAYISQSTLFTICIFVIGQFAYEMWHDGRRSLALALIALALIILAKVFYVATARTALVVIPVLTLVFGYKLSGWKGAIGLIVACFVLAAAAWPSSTYLRTRIVTFFHELDAYRRGGAATSAGERLLFWRKSVEFIREAPVFGHGTGSIHEQFQRSTVGQTGMASYGSTNPHNQTFAVGIQLGLVGIAVLYAMWIAHLALY